MANLQPNAFIPVDKNAQAVRVLVVGGGIKGDPGIQGLPGNPGGPITVLDKNLHVYMDIGGADELSTGLFISATPVGWIGLEVNGLKETIGDGIKMQAAYFSDDGGATALALSAVTLGSELFWNALLAGYALSTLDVLDFIYAESP